MSNQPFILSLSALLILSLGFKTAQEIHHMRAPQLYAATSISKQIFVASSLDRIFLNGKTLQKPSFSSTVVLSAAQNDYEDFQIVVDARSKAEPDIVLEGSDLRDVKTGSNISKDHWSWRVVGYVPTQKPYYAVKYVGLWPDPLITVDAFDVKAGTVQPFWVTLYVPPDTPAGLYKGTIEVKGSHLAAQKIPVQLQVYAFSLPPESHLKTAFDFYGQLTKFRYPQGPAESNETWHARLDGLNDQFIINMIKHRMNPVLNIDPTNQSDLANIDRYRVYGLNNFAIGKNGGTFDNNWPRDDASIENLKTTYQTYGEDLKINGLLQDTYIYTWDEGDIGNPQVPKIAAMIHQAYPGLKNMVCYHGFWDPSQNPDWGRDLDIWTFQIDNFDEAGMHRLQKTGMEMWMYISGPSGKTSPNLALDFDAIDARIIPWICWKYDIKGFLYWCVNYWPDEDPFKNTRNTKWEQNGNGLLFYPGQDGPVDSIRTENFRDGMQDYELIQLLLDKLRVIRSKNLEGKYKAEFSQSIQLLTMDDTLIKDMWQFTKDGEILKSRRDAIAAQIDKLNHLEGLQ